MTIAFDVAERWKARIPEVVHKDGSARVQVVSEASNPRFYRLISELERHTGNAVVLNTSMNRRGEPMVCTPADALDMFYGSDLRILDHGGHPDRQGLGFERAGRFQRRSQSGMTTVNFYHDLPALESFAETIETDRHAQVPGDWWIVVADVIGSTKAIEAGAYKKVNTVGVACIAAVVNVDRSVDMPFVFGGDGATFAVPGQRCASA